MWPLTARTRFAVLKWRESLKGTSSQIALIGEEGSLHFPLNQLIAYRHICSGTEGMKNDAAGDVVSEKSPVFADPRDPKQHPLASLSTEEMQQRQEYWKKVQSENKPTVYKQKINENGEAFAIGSRKRSKAQVWIRNGTGQIVVNDRPWVDYFYRLDLRDKILHPFGLLGLMGKMDVKCRVIGGGPKGQAEALRHGIARALQNWDPLYRPALKSEGLLMRDSREVESKKYGWKKARTAFQ